MLDTQIAKLKTILTDEDLQKYAQDSFWGLVQAVVASDPFAAMAAGKDIKELVCHMPTILFWDKMKKYLMGTFYNYEDQVKLAQKFDCEENGAYDTFVKQQIHIINSLDDDMKVDFFAALTRSFLLTDLEKPLFFKLCKYISMCTVDELLFLKECPSDIHCSNSVQVSALYQYGLFVQESPDETGTIYYKLSDFALALKQHSLNFDDGLHGASRIERYNQMEPLSILEPMNNAEVSQLWKEF